MSTVSNTDLEIEVPEQSFFVVNGYNLLYIPTKIYTFLYNNFYTILLIICVFWFWNILNKKLKRKFRRKTLLSTKQSQYEIDDYNLKKQLNTFDKNTRPYDTAIYDDTIVHLTEEQMKKVEKEKPIYIKN